MAGSRNRGETGHREQSDGGLTRIGAIDFGDGDGRFAKLRRQVRNPSLLTFFIMALVALSIPVAIAFPGFYSGAQEGIVRIRQDASLNVLEVSTPSYVFPYLQRNIQLMKEAQTQLEWRRVSYKLGPCYERNLEQFPEGKYTAGIMKACVALHEIQLDYADDCLGDSCTLPPTAIARLNAVSEDLNETFSDAYATHGDNLLGTGE